MCVAIFYLLYRHGGFGRRCGVTLNLSLVERFPSQGAGRREESESLREEERTKREEDPLARRSVGTR